MCVLVCTCEKGNTQPTSQPDDCIVHGKLPTGIITVSNQKSQEEQNMYERFGITSAEVRAQIKPLFLWMYDHGITSINITRNDKFANVTIDGSQV